MPIDQTLLIPTLRGRAGLPAETIADIVALAAGQYWDLEAFKSADTSRDSTTIRTDDPDLILPVSIGRWLAQFEILATSASATPDIRFAFGLADGLSVSDWLVKIASISTLVSIQDEANNATPATSTIIQIASGRTNLITIKAFFTATVAGTFSFQWAQSTSNATATTVLQNSLMKIHRLGNV